MSRLKQIMLFNIFALALISIATKCSAEASAMFFDPAPMHDVLGVNRFPIYKNDKWFLDLHITPFFQHSSGARDKNGNKVAEGDRLGMWSITNMLNYNVITTSGIDQITHKTWNEDNFLYMYDLDYSLSYGYWEDSISDIWEPTNEQDGYYSIAIEYEKIGLRLELDCALAAGFGVCLKGGFVSYKQDPTFTDSTTDSTTGAYLKAENYPEEGTYLNTAYLTQNLMTEFNRKKLVEDLDLDIDKYYTTALEDTFIQLYWSHPFDLNDEENNLVATVYPYLSVGTWIPTGKKKDQDKVFSLPTGNDGHLGISFEGALNFHFPNMLTLNAGAGITFFDDQTIEKYRTPNYEKQSGIYPWQTTINRRLGTTWNINLSIEAKNIVDSLTFYADYVYTKHERDSVTIESANHPECFLPEKVERESEFKSQTVQAGFLYDLTPNLAFGLAGQTHISGIRVYKTHTVVGSITFSF
jgi:hypothetical protein